MNQATSSANIDASIVARLGLSALERTAFVFAEALDEPDASGPEPVFATRITFTGARTGEAILSASEGFIRELAAGLLSTEPDEVDIDECGQDALNEFGNIIGGLIIKQLGNDHHRIFLGLPGAVAPDSKPASTFPAFTCTLDSSGQRMHICVAVQPADARAAA